MKEFRGRCDACEFKLAADAMKRNNADAIEQAVALYVSQVGRDFANARMAFQHMERIHNAIHAEQPAIAV